MNGDKKYNLLKFSAIAVVLLLLAILLLYVSYYDITSIDKTETNYYTFVLGIFSWGGFVGSLVKLILIYDEI